MTGNPSSAGYIVSDEEKVASIMAYLSNGMVWGETVVKQAIRVSTWLRTNAAPEKIILRNAKMLLTTTSGSSRPSSFRELIVPVALIGAYHLIPPASDPLDYDPTEPNRVMILVSLMIGSSNINGKMRMTQQSSLSKYLDVTHESFSSIYDAEITNILLPSLGTLKVPYLQARQEMCLFGTP